MSKSSNSKRVALPRISEYSRTFVKDWERLSRTGRFDMRQLREVMFLLLANDAPLAAEWLDHPLKGEWVGHRECHVGGDFLLIYQLLGEGTRSGVGFVRAGAHAELFNE